MFKKFLSIINSLYNYRQIKKNKVVIGDTSICGRIRIINSAGKISIGNKCMINSGKGHNPIGGDTICRLISYGGIISVGNRVGISNSTIVSRSSITIEDDVFIGGSCKIYDNDFHPLSFDERVSFSEKIPQKPIVIKKGAFIGAHTIVLKGSVIGEKSIVGAGSVVTCHIPDGEIWAGNPVKFIRKVEMREQNEYSDC